MKFLEQTTRFLPPSTLETVASHCGQYKIQRRIHSNAEKSRWWIIYESPDMPYPVYLSGYQGDIAMFEHVDDAKSFVEQHAREQE